MFSCFSDAPAKKKKYIWETENSPERLLICARRLGNCNEFGTGIISRRNIYIYINDGCEFTVTVERGCVLVTNNDPRVSPSITSRARLELCESNCLTLRNSGHCPRLTYGFSLRLSVQLDLKPMHFSSEVKVPVKA